MPPFFLAEKQLILDYFNQGILLPPSNDQNYLNEHQYQIWLFFPGFSEEMRELSLEDRNLWWLNEFNVDLKNQFFFDSHSLLAYRDSQKHDPSAKAVLSLVNPDIIYLICSGKNTANRDLFQRLKNMNVQSVYLSSPFLINTIENFFDLKGFCHDFAENKHVFYRGQSCSGAYYGENARHILQNSVLLYGDNFSLTEAEILVYETDVSPINISQKGCLNSHGKMSSGLDVILYWRTQLAAKYENLRKSIIRWDADVFCHFLEGTPVRYEFRKSCFFPGQLKYLFQNTNKRIGVTAFTNKISRKMYETQLTDLSTGASLFLEMSRKEFQAYLLDEDSIPLLWKIEHYLRQVFDPYIDISHV